MHRFNIRVYGILINERKEVLVTDEFRMGMEITKFPGGGLEFGEGTIDCLKREFLEEINQEIRVIRHIYTTDFFQPSAFNPMDQLISIYYLVGSVKEIKLQASHKKFDFIKRTDGEQTFRWLPLNTITPDEFTFPIDKKVATMLVKFSK